MAARLCTVCRPLTAPRVLHRVQHRSVSHYPKPSPHRYHRRRGPPPRSPATKSFSPPSQRQVQQEVLEALQAIDRRYTFRGWHILRFLAFFGVGSTAVGIYFQEPLIKFLSGQGSEVARQTMQDDRVKEEVDRITQATTNTLLNDPNTVQVTIDFILRVLQKEETRQQAVSFVSKLLRDPVTLGQLRESLNMLLQDATVRNSINTMVFQLLQDPETQRLLESLAVDLLERERVQVTAADFVANVLRRPQVIDAAAASSQDIIQHLSRDERVHHDLASAGSSALKRMVVPGFLLRTPEKEGNKVNEENEGELDILDVEQQQQHESIRPQ